MTNDQKIALVEAARGARTNAYVAYSNYRVGAAILAEDGNIYAGCNVENAAYPEGTCAEAGAIAAMALAGARDIVAIAVVGGKRDMDLDDGKPWDVCTPCGGCRQKIAEFAQSTQTPVIIANPDAIALETTVGDILPFAFNLKA